MLKILIVEDDAQLATTLKYLVEDNPRYRVILLCWQAMIAAQAWVLLQQGWDRWLLGERGRDGKVIDWLDELTAECPKKTAHNMNDPLRCAVPGFSEGLVALLQSLGQAFVDLNQTRATQRREARIA